VALILWATPASAQNPIRVNTKELAAAVNLGLQQSETFRALAVRIAQRQAVVIVMRLDPSIKTQRYAELYRASTDEKTETDEQGTHGCLRLHL
jgi:prolyl-tRNA editing enzyme YbaK/EbsC (Cys-tRNA(Pro) deacylase)